MGLDAAGAVGEVVFALNDMLDQIVLHKGNLAIGVVGILVARFDFVVVADAGDAIEVVIGVPHNSAIAVLHLGECTVVGSIGIVLIHIRRQHHSAHQNAGLTAQMIILESIGHIMSSVIINVMLHASQHAASLIIGVLIAVLMAINGGHDLSDTALSIMLVDNGLTLGISDTGSNALVGIDLRSDSLAARVSLRMDVVIRMLEFGCSTGDEVSATHSAAGIRTLAVTMRIIAEVAAGTERRTCRTQEVLLLRGRIRAVAKGAAQRVARSGILRQVVCIIEGGRLNCARRSRGAHWIALCIISVVRAESLRIQEQTSQVSIVHLLTHIHTDQDAAEILGCSDASAGKLPAALLMVKHRLAATDPATGTREQHVDTAVGTIIFIVQLGKSAAPAAHGEPIILFAVNHKFLLNAELIVGIIVRIQMQSTTSQHRRRLNCAFGERLGGQVSAETVFTYTPASCCSSTCGNRRTSLVLHHVEMVASTSFLQLHTRGPAIPGTAHAHDRTIDLRISANRKLKGYRFALKRLIGGVFQNGRRIRINVERFSIHRVDDTQESLLSAAAQVAREGIGLTGCQCNQLPDIGTSCIGSQLIGFRISTSLSWSVYLPVP